MIVRCWMIKRSGGGYCSCCIEGPPFFDQIVFRPDVEKGAFRRETTRYVVGNEGFFVCWWDEERCVEKLEERK